MEKNIFLTLLGLIVGILLYRFFNINIYFFYLLVLSGLVFFKKSRQARYFLLAGLIFFANVFFLRGNFQNYQVGSRLFLDGQVLELKVYEGSYKRILLKDKSREKFFVGGDNLDDLEPGDFVKGQIEIVERNDKKNFQMSSIDDYYIRENIVASGKNLSLKAYDKSAFLSSFKYQLIRKINDSIDSNLSEDSAAIVKKLVLADTSSLDEDLRDSYSRAGLSHLLAISGLHIYIIIFFLDFILKRLGMAYNSRFGLITAALVFYAYILDFTPSLTRALLMYFLKVLFEILKIKLSNISILALALLIILAFKPMALFDLALHLTFLSVLAIILIYPKLNPCRKSGLFGIFSLYLSVNIMILPLLIYNFNNFNVFSFISNLIVSPVIIFVLVLSYFAIILDLLLSFTFLYFIIDQLIASLNFYVALFLSNFDLYLKVFMPSLGLILSYYIILYLFFFRSKDEKIYAYKKLIFVLMAFVLAFNVSDLFYPKLSVGFFDVGQGDSAYMIYKDKYIQIDTGGTSYSDYNPGIEITAKAIEKRGIRKIDLLVLSHFDADHVLGAQRLIEDGLVKAVLINGPEEDNELYQDLVRTGVHIYYPKNKRLYLDKVFYLEFFNTGPRGFEDSNDRSLVVLANYMDKKILFTGDISKGVEEKLQGKIGPVNILKVSHHGSKTASSLDFLWETRPDFAIISADKNNPYGHPHQEVLENLEKVRAKLLQTSQEGEIVFEISDSISYTSARNPRLNLIVYERLGFFVIIFIASMYFVKLKEEDNELQRF